MQLEAIYITVEGQRRRITDPHDFERAIREIVRSEVRKLQDEGYVPTDFDRSED